MKTAFVRHKFSKQLNITHIISTFYYKSPKNFYFEGEAHDFWEFIYVDKGRLLITAGEHRYVLKTGELAFHRPNEFHAVQACDNLNSNFIVSSFVCKSPCMKFFDHKILSLNTYERQCLYKAVDDATLFLGEGSPKGHPNPVETPLFGVTQLLQSHLEQMLISLYQRGDSLKIQHRIDTYIQQNTYNRMAEMVIGYLESHLNQPLKLEEIAAALCCSVAQLKKLFHAQCGKGVIDYFIDLKIGEAKRLITEGNDTFAQIASQLGYDNISYFSKLFKSRTDMTMTEYSRSIGK